MDIKGTRRIQSGVQEDGETQGGGKSIGSEQISI